MFLGWFDDTPKKPVTQKIEEAVERYVAKFGSAPNVCLVNVENVAAISGVDVRPVEYVRPNHFWVGRDESLVQPVETAETARAA